MKPKQRTTKNPENEYSLIAQTKKFYGLTLSRNMINMLVGGVVVAVILAIKFMGFF